MINHSIAFVETFFMDESTDGEGHQYAMWVCSPVPRSVYVYRSDCLRDVMRDFVKLVGEAVIHQDPSGEMLREIVARGGFAVYYCDYPYSSSSEVHSLWVTAMPAILN